MSDQEKKIAALYEAFGIYNDRHMEPEECERTPQPLLTPEAELEVLRRRHRLEDQIMRDMFRVLVDGQFVADWYYEHKTLHTAHIVNAAKLAAKAARNALQECDINSGIEYEQRFEAMEMHLKALGVQDD